MKDTVLLKNGSQKKNTRINVLHRCQVCAKVLSFKIYVCVCIRFLFRTRSVEDIILLYSLFLLHIKVILSHDHKLYFVVSVVIFNSLFFHLFNDIETIL